MVASRHVRIILAGVLVLLVVIVSVFLLRQPSDQTSSQPTLGANNADLIVQTLFAQTAVAQANAQANASVNIVIQNPPTSVPTVPVFPQEAYSALLRWAREYESSDRTNNVYSLDFVIVSSHFATNLRGDALGSAFGLEEAWCVVTSPPVITLYQPGGIGDRDDNTIDHFILNRYGVRWDVRDLVFEASFQQMGCRNW